MSSGGAIIEIHDEVTYLTVTEQVVEVIEIADFALATDRIPASIGTQEGQLPVCLAPSSWGVVTPPAANNLLLTSDLTISGKSKWSAPPSGILGLDGWTTADTWTYVSASSFKVTGADVTARYQHGTQLKCTDGGSTKYFYVVSSSYGGGDTTVTITGGSDYSLSGGAITNTFFSYFSNPQGFPDWFNYVPTITGFSSPPTASTYRFCIKGTTVFVGLSENGFGTSNATTKTYSLPVAAKVVTNISWMGSIPVYLDNNSVGYLGSWLIFSGGSIANVYKASLGNWTASGNCMPFGGGVGSPRGVVITYEMA